MASSGGFSGAKFSAAILSLLQDNEVVIDARLAAARVLDGNGGLVCKQMSQFQRAFVEGVHPRSVNGKW